MNKKLSLVSLCVLAIAAFSIPVFASTVNFTKIPNNAAQSITPDNPEQTNISEAIVTEKAVTEIAVTEIAVTEIAVTEKTQEKIGRDTLKPKLGTLLSAPPEDFNGFAAVDATTRENGMSFEVAAEKILDLYESSTPNPYEYFEGKNFDEVCFDMYYGYNKKLDTYGWTGLIYTRDEVIFYDENGVETPGGSCDIIYSCSLDAVTGTVYSTIF